MSDKTSLTAVITSLIAGTAVQPVILRRGLSMAMGSICVVAAAAGGD